MNIHGSHNAATRAGSIRCRRQMRVGGFTLITLMVVTIAVSADALSFCVYGTSSGQAYRFEISGVNTSFGEAFAIRKNVATGAIPAGSLPSAFANAFVWTINTHGPYGPISDVSPRCENCFTVLHVERSSLSFMIGSRAGSMCEVVDNTAGCHINPTIRYVRLGLPQLRLDRYLEEIRFVFFSSRGNITYSWETKRIDGSPGGTKYKNSSGTRTVRSRGPILEDNYVSVSPAANAKRGEIHEFQVLVCAWGRCFVSHTLKLRTTEVGGELEYEELP